MPSRVKTLVLFTAHFLTWLIFIFAVGVSCLAFLSQAVRTSARQSIKNNINLLIIGVAYVIVLVMSVALCLKRRFSMFRRLQRISKGHIAIGKGDVPNAVHDFISQEYARTCLVALESLPKEAHQEGWGRPGTKYAGVQFRRSLLDTIPILDGLSRLLIPSQPALRPNDRMLHHHRFIAPLMPKDDDGLSPLHYYDSAIQLARHFDREPTEREYDIGITAANQIKTILYECHLEMYEGSLTDLDRSPSVVS
ncbi:hypothetical protein BV25DRAFT_1819120 [Artomyces pyxidatus]|uniref:Uncharacterized protein n=1 Tax=Artomyces pyxidatus TaxID=48021 RepID=A0ACB8TGX5_9AGAM|nr:hypothetical protein BV25DRAFT_1819120 [Artomyces pyxidatus]